jgi:uncharacterized membrane protein YhaH (DUF805 family)
VAPPPAPPRRPGLAKTFLWVFARFDGRIGRQVYWLSNILLVAVLALFVRPVVDPQTNQVSVELGTFGAVALVLAIVSSLAVGAKRLHDFGASGLFAGLLVVPLLSLIVTVVIGVVPGTPGPNRYGEAADRPPR